MRTKLEAKREVEFEKIKEENSSTTSDYERIDKRMLEQARQLESKRTKTLKTLEETIGIPLPKETGTSPQADESSGILGDRDFASMTAPQFDKWVKEVKELGYTVKLAGDTATINELDTTLHRKPSPYTSTEGSSARDTERKGHASSKETAVSHDIKEDPLIHVMDNLKKSLDTLYTQPEKLTREDIARMAKMTKRNMEQTKIENPELYDTLIKLKQRYSVESQGLNVTELQKVCKEINKTAYQKAQKESDMLENQIKTRIEDTRLVLKAAQQNHDAEEENILKEQLVNERKDLLEKQGQQSAVQKALTDNQKNSHVFY